jgi:TatD DNase family protein
MLLNERHRAMVSSLPLEKLLTETDGPFVKIDGRDARPADVSHTVEALARLRSMPRLELEEIIMANLKRLVSE